MKFEIIDQTGKNIECDVVGLFNDETRNINYVIYTDGTKNEEGKLEIYASRYTKENSTFTLHDIEEDSEWDLIDRYLAKMNKR